MAAGKLTGPATMTLAPFDVWFSEDAANVFVSVVTACHVTMNTVQYILPQIKMKLYRQWFYEEKRVIGF